MVRQVTTVLKASRVMPAVIQVAKLGYWSVVKSSLLMRKRTAKGIKTSTSSMRLNISCLRKDILVSLSNLVQGLNSVLILLMIFLKPKCLLMTRSSSISAQSLSLNIFWKYTLSLSERVMSILIMMMRQSSIAVNSSEMNRKRQMRFFQRARKTNRLMKQRRIITFISMLNQQSFLCTGLARLNTLSFRVFSFIYVPESFQWRRRNDSPLIYRGWISRSPSLLISHYNSSLATDACITYWLTGGRYLSLEGLGYSTLIRLVVLRLSLVGRRRRRDSRRSLLMRLILLLILSICYYDEVTKEADQRISLLAFSKTGRVCFLQRSQSACISLFLICLLQYMDQQLKKTRILITVGTTEFDQLIEYADSQQFIDTVKKAGFNEDEIIYQFGTTGKYVPAHSNQFRLHPNIQQLYDQHEVVVSHGGAGTLLACLYNSNPKKKIIGVANNTLAGNHQTELISKLHDESYILGFNSVQQLKRGRQELLKLLKGQLKLKKYVCSNKSVLNNLIFGEDL